jgi:glutathione S-transferase
MGEALADGPHLAGNAYSIAECAVIPYLLRLELLRLNALWDREPCIADWWRRVRSRDSTQTPIFARATEADWAPFKNLQSNPRPKVQELLSAASTRSDLAVSVDGGPVRHADTEC